MQERNFEKQVRHKMEEFFLTPSDPVWKKIEEQVRKKRDRRRLFLWLPLSVLLLSGGLWFVATDINTNNSIAKTKKEINKTQSLDSEPGKQIIPEKDFINEDKRQNPVESLRKEQATIERQTLPEQGENAIELKQESTVQQAITTEDGLTQKTNDSKTATSNKSANSISNNKKVLKKTKQAAFLNYTQKTAPSKNNDLKIGNEQASAPTSINETKPLTGVYSDSLAKSTEFNDIDTISNTKPIEKTAENDSVAIQKDIATTRKSISTKWKFAIEAGIGISGVSNGVSLFGGGTKSLSTNAFARDMFLSFSGTPSNTSQGSTYRPPSTQQKSGSSLIF